MTVKRMTRVPAGPGAENWTGPVLVRGWLRVREPWRHPVAVLMLFRKWSRLKKDVDRGEGFLSFEYWQRLNALLFGMHVGWRSHAELLLQIITGLGSHPASSTRQAGPAAVR